MIDGGRREREKKTAEWLNEARRKGKLKGCLSVISFAKKSIDALADYVLHHITLETLQGDKQKESDSEAKFVEDIDRSIGDSSSVTGEETKRKDSKTEEEANNRKNGRNGLKQRIQVLINELGGVQPHVVAERLGISLPEVSETIRELKKEGLVKVARNLPYINSLKKANATYYLDAHRLTALHDTLMNIVWQRNIELGGTCRDYSFDYEGKSWHTDGVLENSGGKFLLEVVAGGYHEEVFGQLIAYLFQIRQDRYLKGVIVVAVDSVCLLKLREKAAGDGMFLGGKLFITALRSVHEKQQFESLLKHGAVNVYHRNLTH
jgi:ribosomal protein S25